MQISLTHNFVWVMMAIVFVLRSAHIQGQLKQEPLEPPGTEDVVEIISNGNDLKLIKHLKNKVDPNGQTSEGVSHLLKAWQTRQRRSFDILLEFGGDPHQILTGDIPLKVDEHELVFPSGSSVAFITMQYAYLRPEFVELVLRYLKRPDQRNANQETILHVLVSSHRIRMDQGRKLSCNNPLDYLSGELPFILALNAGIDINATDADGRTSLDLTIPQEPASPEILAYYKKPFRSLIDDVRSRSTSQLLIRRGANRNITSNDGSCYFDRQKRFAENYKEYDKFPLSKSSKQFGSSASRRGAMDNVAEFNDDVEKTQPPIVLEKHRAEERPWIFSNHFVRMFHDDTNNEINVATIRGFRSFYQLNPTRFPMLEARDFDELVRIGFAPNPVGIGGFTFLWGAMLSASKSKFDQLIQMGASPDMKLTENLWDCGDSIGVRAEEEKMRAMYGY